MKKIISVIVVLFSFTSFAQIVLPLYNGVIPNSLPVADSEKVYVDKNNGDSTFWAVSKPRITAYLPEKSVNKTPAVIICPGGAYMGLAYSHEGIRPAKALQEMGVAAVILKYRLPDDRTMANKEIGPLQDVQQAIKTVRMHAEEWNIDTNKIGVMGFSAGGHLAASAGTHYNYPVIDNKENINLRPDFMILIYPVISFTDQLTHTMTREDLIGKNPSEEKKIFYSNELQVTKNTPPAFIVHSGADEAVKVENSIRMYMALHNNGVESSLLIYPLGEHGFGLNNPTINDKWLNHCREWMISSGWLAK
jgi:acetyl esterase/lipase